MGGSDWVLHYDCTAKIIITLINKLPPVFLFRKQATVMVVVSLCTYSSNSNRILIKAVSQSHS